MPVDNKYKLKGCCKIYIILKRSNYGQHNTKITVLQMKYEATGYVTGCDELSEDIHKSIVTRKMINGTVLWHGPLPPSSM